MSVNDLFPSGKHPVGRFPQGTDGADVAALTKRHQWRRQAWRWALIVLVLALIVMLMRLAGRAPVTEVVQSVDIPVSATVDVSTASSVAESVARNWLIFDADREQRLTPNWDGPGTAGWNGSGAASVSGWTYTVATSVINETDIDVTVAVFSQPEHGASDWVGVLVPMQLTQGRASVRAEPKIVGIPAPAPLRGADLGDTDTDLSAATLDNVSQFFTAWSGGDASGVVAPGAVIASPPSDWGSATVITWKVAQGSGDTRRGTATVTWTIGDSTLTTTYTVTIARVSAGSADRWQVSALN